jgi:GT2 family glycosyltransferase
LPDPPFLEYFHGYSLMEDVALSLEVGKYWRLLSVPKARIYHDSAPASYKSQTVARQAMEVSNRWFVARRVMCCAPLQLLSRMLFLQAIGLLSLLRMPRMWSCFLGWCIGTCLGWCRIAYHARNWTGYRKAREPKISSDYCN